MFRNRDFLIEKGLYPGCREDTFYIIGSIYDEVCQNMVFLQMTFQFILEVQKKSFQYRFTVHKNAVYGEATQYIHKQIKIALERNKKIEFKPLIVIEDLSIKYDREISEDELKCMELALISVLQPIYNIEGVSQPFSF